MKHFNLKNLINKFKPKTMDTLPIKKEAAIKAYKEADNKGKTLLSNLFGEAVFSQKITDRVKTFEDACQVLGISASSVTSSSDTVDEIAYKKLKVIVTALNEGWKPNWDNDSEHKYYPWFDMRIGFGFSFSRYYCWLTTSYVGSRLCFHTEELAVYAGKQFTSIYKDLLTIN